MNATRNGPCQQSIPNLHFTGSKRKGMDPMWLLSYSEMSPWCRGTSHETMLLWEDHNVKQKSQNELIFFYINIILLSNLQIRKTFASQSRLPWNCYGHHSWCIFFFFCHQHKTRASVSAQRIVWKTDCFGNPLALESSLFLPPSPSASAGWVNRSVTPFDRWECGCERWKGVTCKATVQEVP